MSSWVSLPCSQQRGLQGKSESHYFLLLAFSGMGAAFLSDACAIKGKQLTATAACLACLVCGLAGNMQGRECFGNRQSSRPLHPPPLPLLALSLPREGRMVPAMINGALLVWCGPWGTAGKQPKAPGGFFLKRVKEEKRKRGLKLSVCRGGQAPFCSLAEYLWLCR